LNRASLDDAALARDLLSRKTIPSQLSTKAIGLIDGFSVVGRQIGSYQK